MEILEGAKIATLKGYFSFFNFFCRLWRFPNFSGMKTATPQ